MQFCVLDLCVDQQKKKKKRNWTQKLAALELSPMPYHSSFLPLGNKVKINYEVAVSLELSIAKTRRLEIYQMDLLKVRIRDQWRDRGCQFKCMLSGHSWSICTSLPFFLWEHVMALYWHSVQMLCALCIECILSPQSRIEVYFQHSDLNDSFPFSLMGSSSQLKLRLYFDVKWKGSFF